MYVIYFHFCILKAALDENNKMHNNGQHCWISCIYYILKELDMLKMFKSPLTCGVREINIKPLPNLRLCYPPQEYSCINLNLAFQFYDHYISHR
jgi:hypothetical protein